MVNTGLHTISHPRSTLPKRPPKSCNLQHGVGIVIVSNESTSCFQQELERVRWWRLVIHFLSSRESECHVVHRLLIASRLQWARHWRAWQLTMVLLLAWYDCVESTSGVMMLIDELHPPVSQSRKASTSNDPCANVPMMVRCEWHVRDNASLSCRSYNGKCRASWWNGTGR